ncbi:MAG: Era-like GTP-binding protein [Candidatus Thermoplasmatota archaeon]|nr:Era-like GTP-binding protein [Candidatus Thermoplasmatota archaeon]
MAGIDSSSESLFSKWIKRLFGGKQQIRIGLYGPPNAGKTTLANRIVHDWTGEVMGSVSPVPHETRRVKKKANVVINNGGGAISLDVVDTPGIATKIDYHEFMDFGMNEEDSKRRAKEATEGVIEAIRWLDEVDGIILVMDSAEDPFTQVNITLIGNIEARKLPVVIAANKIDLPNASPASLKSAFPQHPVIPISAMSGHNMDQLYKRIIKEFR